MRDVADAHDAVGDVGDDRPRLRDRLSPLFHRRLQLLGNFLHQAAGRELIRKQFALLQLRGGVIDPGGVGVGKGPRPPGGQLQGIPLQVGHYGLPIPQHGGNESRGVILVGERLSRGIRDALDKTASALPSGHIGC